MPVKFMFLGPINVKSSKLIDNVVGLDVGLTGQMNFLYTIYLLLIIRIIIIIHFHFSPIKIEILLSDIQFHWAAGFG